MNTPTRLLTIAAAVAGLATHVRAAPDEGFLKKALIGDNSEMTLGQMAATNGTSQATRDFGQMLHDDHDAARQKTLPVAKAHGVTDTGELSPEARAEQRKLEALRGAAFDAEFARYMVEDHKRDIADFEAQTRSGDKEIADLARGALPDLEKHLRAAESLVSAR